MINLREFRHIPDRLSDLLPWAALVAPGIVLNKDGSFQATISYRGPDLDSSTDSELIAVAARTNNVLKRLGSSWAIYCEAQRVQTREYPQSSFPDPISALIDEERKAVFKANKQFESFYYLTLVFLPPPDTKNKIIATFIESGKKQQQSYSKLLSSFQSDINRITEMLRGVFSSIHQLSSEETLTYLHNTISEKHHTVRLPEIPMYLDTLLADTPLLPGFEPSLGKKHLRVVSVLGFPGKSQPGLLDTLNRLGSEYRFVTRFICLDKTEALEEISRYKKRWFAKRKSITTLLKEVLTNSESIVSDSDAINKALDADAALQELSDDLVSYGYFTNSVIIISFRSSHWRRWTHPNSWPNRRWEICSS